MIRTTTALAVIAPAMLAASAHAAVLSYQFNGTLTNNNIMSGGFAGASVGAPVSLQITIETTTLPSFNNPERNHWDGVAGTILGMKATVDGYTSVTTPNSAPVRARVADDAANGGVFIDQFWFEVNMSAPSPDFLSGSAVLGNSGAAAPISSSLSGTFWPTTSAEIDPSSFPLEHYIILRGNTGGEYLRADITQTFVAPSPGVLALGVLGAPVALRRRR